VENLVKDIKTGRTPAKKILGYVALASPPGNSTYFPAKFKALLIFKGLEIGGDNQFVKRM